MKKLSINNKEANTIYEKTMSIITKEIKNKLNHPFNSID